MPGSTVPRLDRPPVDRRGTVGDGSRQLLCQGIRYDGAFNVGGVFQEGVGGEEGAAEFGGDLDGRCVVEIPDRVFGDCSGATAQEVRGNLVGFLVGVEDHRRRTVAVEFELKQAGP